jgi:hypothetical protein
VTEVIVEIEVHQQNGSPALNLAPEDVAVYEDGQLRKTTSIESMPMRVLVMFDCFSFQPNLLLEAAGTFAATLDPDARISIAAYGSSIVRLLDWNQSQGRRLGRESCEETREESPDGEPSAPMLNWRLYQNAWWAVGDVQTQDVGRPAVLMLTDGLGWPDNRDRTLGLLEAAGVPVYIVAVPPPRWGSSGDALADSIRTDSYDSLSRMTAVQIGEIARVSGGRVLWADRANARETAEFFAQMKEEVRGGAYWLSYVSDNPDRDTSGRRIEVRPARAGLTVRQSREGYTARQDLQN